MACRDAYEIMASMNNGTRFERLSTFTEPAEAVYRLLFGVDSKVPASTLLQNNLTQFEWVTRNKIYPGFWGRNITGENCLTKDEVYFLHGKACKIAPFCFSDDVKETYEQGKALAMKTILKALELGIPKNTAIYMELEDTASVTKDYLLGYVEEMLREGFIPGFKANTDAACDFDREYSRGMQTDPEMFERCLIWATEPTLEEYNGITTTHLIHPDNWMPYAPSGCTMRDVAVWQYGRDCHPIENREEKRTAFNINLIRNTQVLIRTMF